jgi:hypothetical protein
MPIVRERPRIVDPYINEPSLARPAHDAIIQRSTKKVGKDRQYLELHSDLPVAPGRMGIKNLASS